ncbi:unnamed protein product [Larinioides sclopetarius]|uniref:EF-hand domain-containing protein n=1 Tax=Larinioides sclopetarius TaxID=280406 RepID=A0AAV1Z3A7_9ARAC
MADEESTEKSSGSKAKLIQERRLKNIFARPRYAEPRHPIFSSPFARHISMKAFGPKKPRWYQSLTTAQLYLFKDIMNYVEVGRENFFRFNDFLGALQDFDPSITRSEVLDVIDNMEMNEFEELDFGKFLFLLAYRDQESRDYPENVEEKLSSKHVTPRQSLILSAIAYFVLIASPEEIERYYFQNTRRKATVLHHHLEATRLEGLTERQMEVKQRNAAKHLGPLFYLTGSPYALPVPFVPRFKKSKLFKELQKRRDTYPRSALPYAKRPIARPITPLKFRRELGQKAAFESKVDEMASLMNHGRIPLPQMRFPAEKLKQMRAGGYTVELKDYIMEKADEALKRFRRSLKETAVVYAKQNMKPMLREGFPTKYERDKFIEVYQRYLPIKVSDVKNCSLWVRPAGYRVSHDGKPLYPDKFAFGSKIP